MHVHVHCDSCQDLKESSLHESKLEQKINDSQHFLFPFDGIYQMHDCHKIMDSASDMRKTNKPIAILRSSIVELLIIRNKSCSDNETRMTEKRSKKINKRQLVHENVYHFASL